MTEGHRLGLAEDYARVTAANEYLAAALRHLTAEPSRLELERISHRVQPELRDYQTTDLAVAAVILERDAYRDFIFNEVIPAFNAANVHILVDRARAVLDGRRS